MPSQSGKSTESKTKSKPKAKKQPVVLSEGTAVYGDPPKPKAEIFGQASPEPFVVDFGKWPKNSEAEGLGLFVPIAEPDLTVYHKRQIRIKWAKEEREACLSVLAALMKQSATLENGRVVSTLHDAVRWVFGQIAAKKSELGA